MSDEATSASDTPRGLDSIVAELDDLRQKLILVERERDVLLDAMKALLGRVRMFHRDWGDFVDSVDRAVRERSSTYLDADDVLEAIADGDAWFASATGQAIKAPHREKDWVDDREDPIDELPDPHDFEQDRNPHLADESPDPVAAELRGLYEDKDIDDAQWAGGAPEGTGTRQCKKNEPGDPEPEDLPF